MSERRTYETPAVGEVVRHWTVERVLPASRMARSVRVDVVGACGARRTFSVRALRIGKGTSCKCSKRPSLANSPERSAHKRMLARCENPNHHRAKTYSRRGIKVCERWRGRGGFARFLADLGRRPSPDHSLDRIDVDGHYEPSNVRWATRQQQARNTTRTRYVVIEGVRRAAVYVCEQHHVPLKAFYARTRRGWDASLAATTPVGTHAHPVRRPRATSVEAVSTPAAGAAGDYADAPAGQRDDALIVPQTTEASR